MTFFELTVNWVLLIEHIQLLVFCGNYFIFYWQDISMIWLGFVIKSKVALCTTRRQGVESRKITLFRKPGGWEDVRLSSVQFSHSVMPDSLWSHESQHARPPCPSLTPGVLPNLCPLSWWCHPAISSSVVPFSSCPQSLPGSGSFPMSQLFASGDQSIGVSASASVLPMNT